MRESSWRIEPAAAFRGLAKAGSSRSVIQRLRSRNASSGMIASPRIATERGGAAPRSLSGTVADRADVGRDVLADAPSPRVAPRASTPSS